MLLSVSELSEITGKDRRTIKRYADTLKAVKDGRAHKYESRELIPLLYGVSAADGEKLDLSQERARLAKLQGDKADLELKEMRGDLLRRDDVVSEVSEAIANCRAKLLNIPAKAAAVTVAAESVPEAQRLLHELVCEALDELYSEYAEA
jgi:phage terminase Nu1 subunit (DNA packaging protein)